jgi:hypothetical protein
LPRKRSRVRSPFPAPILKPDLVSGFNIVDVWRRGIEVPDPQVGGEGCVRTRRVRGTTKRSLGITEPTKFSSSHNEVVALPVSRSSVKADLASVFALVALRHILEFLIRKQIDF